LRSCPGVKDAVVCAIMGAAGFEQAFVGVVLASSTDIDALRKRIEANTNFGTNIDRLFVVEVIPRGTLGKIQRDELKELLLSLNENSDL
jgi:acyl-coenzyme A synthetase/AMP-(fatty) acid ligase